MYKKNHHIHFVGIGGIGMSGIAELLLNLGYRVSGSDLNKTDLTQRLLSLGATIYEGHDKKNIDDVDVVVLSSAINSENPEVIIAKENNIPIIPRAEMLAELMRLKYGIAIAGSHGKTTTTSLVACVLEYGGIDPTVVIGGKLNKTNTNAFLGQGDFLVAEADESDGSFLKLPPTIAVVTNIDREHMDFYRDLNQIKDTFVEFLNKVPFYGISIICLDNENLQSIIPRLEKRILTYGCSSQADIQARDIEIEGYNSKFNVYMNDKKLGIIKLNMPGVHNVCNALAAVGVGLELNVQFKTIKKALAEFKGVHRRFQIRGTKKSITWVDDYAHHPTEIKMTLKAAKASSKKRVVVLFQPHRYTRTRDLFKEFMSAFNEADVLIITDIYAAGEKEIEGVNSQKFYQSIKDYGHKDVTFIPKLSDAEIYLKDNLKKNDLFLTMGAGNVWKSGENIINML
jgi:UDP-N-acetylmuramate--alanine ligase